MPTPTRPLPRPDFQWVLLENGRPAQVFAQYMSSLDALAKLLAAGQIGPLTNAANDAAAAAAGIAIGQLYRNGSVVQIRVT